MKILFVCDWDFSYLWEQVAGVLHKTGELDQAYGLVVGKLYYDWLKKNTRNFEDLWLLQKYTEFPSEEWFDVERLEALDERYGDPTIWRFLWADRDWVYETYPNAVKLLNCTFSFYEWLYDEIKPDLIVTNAFASMCHLVGHAVAKGRGIPVLAPLNTRIRSCHLPIDNPFNYIHAISEATEKPSESAVHDARAYIASFRQKPAKPRYEAVNLRKRREAMVLGPLRFLRYIHRYYFSRVYRNDHTKSNPVSRLSTEMGVIFQKIRIKSGYLWDRVEDGEKFFFFPLHVQPEASTMTLAPFFLNQVALIENLAKSMPWGMQVVVKEHPQMVGKRRRSFYDQLRRIANVKMVEPHADSFDLIKRSTGVATITGTAGLEGLLMGKPVVTFGHVFYSACPLVKKLERIPPEDWADSIRSYVESYPVSDELLEDFVARIIEQSWSMHVIEPLSDLSGVLGRGNVEAVAKFVAIEGKRAVLSEASIRHTG